MSRPIISREQVAEHLAVPARLLILYESRGLVRSVSEGDVEGYEPTEIRRLWTIVSCQRDLGINLAGIEAVLKLRDELASVHQQLHALARDLRSALDEREPESDA